MNKSDSKLKVITTLIALEAIMSFNPAVANPEGGFVAGGNAQIIQTSASRIDINQSSNNAIINWNSFSINQNEHVNFNQPSSTSLTLNRVIGSDLSRISGKMTANGRIMLVNPNGVLFTPTAKVDVGGLLTTVSNISDDNFKNNIFDFNQSSSVANASIVNQGIINARGGMALLAAKSVKNEGTITNQGGTTALVSANKFKLSFLDSSNINIQVDESVLTTLENVSNLVDNTGNLISQGGNIILQANVADTVLNNAVNTSGVVKANTVKEANGKIVLGSVDIIAQNGMVTTGGTISATGEKGGNITIVSSFAGLGGTIDASGNEGGNISVSTGVLSLAENIKAVGTSGKGGNVVLNASGRTWETSTSNIDVSGYEGGSIYHQANEQIITSGNYFANGSLGVGGTINITAPALKFLSAKIIANGATSGGYIMLGGEYQGGKDVLQDVMPNASTLAMTSSTEVSANGLTGGQIICWADQNAFVLGDFSAKGSLSGGFIEISSGDTLTFGGTADAGKRGTFLLDPKNITIAEPNVSQYPIIMGYNYSAQNSNNINASSDFSADQFGVSVSINDNRLVIGATGDDGYNNTKVNTGAVYLYTLDDASFSGGQLAGIIGYGYTGGNNVNQVIDNFDQFGRSVSLDGTSLAVGAPYDDGNANVSANSGAVYLYTFTDTDFSGGNLVKRIGRNYEINQDVSTDDRFGMSVSLDGTRLAVGAYLDDGYNNPSGYSDSGCVYLYNFTDTNFSGGTLAKRIGKSYEINLELGSSDYFGMALSLSGNSLAIGAPYDDGLSNPSGYTDSGVVYLYTFTDSSFGGGTLVKRIGKNYEISPAVETNDRFGFSVALNGTALAVGTPYDDGNLNGFTDTGAIYLYNFTNTSFSGGTLLKRIGKNYEINQSLDNSDYFGYSLSIDGAKLATGVYYEDGYNNIAGDMGAVYVYSFLDQNFSGGTLSQIIGVNYPASNSVTQVLNDASSDQLGRSISLDGYRLVVGAANSNDTAGTRVNTGSVYLYTFSDDSFSNMQLEGIIGDGYTGGKNINITLDSNDYFGVSTSLDGNRLAVGASGDDANANVLGSSGAVYLFTFTDSSFSGGSLVKRIGKNYELNETALGGDDSFGYSVSLDGKRLAVGALYDDGFNNPSGYSNSGGVYLYSFDDLNFSGGTLVKRIGKNYDVNVSLDSTDYFGISVSLDSTRLAIGAYGDDGSGNSTYLANSGCVYLFTFDDLNFSGGTQVKTIGSGYDIDPNIDINEYFGWAVSLSGNSLAVGFHGDDGAGNQYSDVGAVYIYNFDDASFSGGTLAQKIGRGYAFDSLLESADNFGISLSLDGTRLAVGAVGDDGYWNLAGGGGTGSVYLYKFTDTTYSSGQLLRVIGSGYTDTNSINTPVEVGNSQFGRSVSLDGNMLVVGENTNDGLTRQYENYGAVYMYTFTDSSFSGGQLAGIIGNGYTGGKNINQSLQPGDTFGTAVSLDNNRLAVGVPSNNSYLNYKTDAGAVYLYTFTDSSFSGGQLACIIGDGYTGGNNINQSLDSSDLFGYAVSLDGNRLAVGAVNDDGLNNPSGYSNSGAVYLYTFSDGNFTGGTLVKRIGKNYDINQALESADQFGWAVSLSGTGLAVGISLDDGLSNAVSDSGAVFLYKFDDTSFSGGSLVKTIGKGYNIDLALGSSDRFGYSVSLDGTRLAIGSMYDDGYSNVTADSGCVYLYTFDTTSFGTGTLVKQIGRNYGVNLTLEAYDSFGTAVSLDGTRLAIGAIGDDGYNNVATNTGAVYLYTFTDTSFGGGTLAGTIGANYTGGKNVNEYLQFNDYGDQLGRAVSLDGNRLVIGENLNDGLNNSSWASGAVYLYTFSDSSFNGGQLAGIIGNGYTGGKNINQTLDINDQFGSAVALEGTRLVVGAPYDDGNNNSRTDSGAVYLYNFADTSFSTGTLVKRVGDGYEVGLTLGTSDYLGWSVSLDGNNLAIGAPYDDGNGNVLSNSGAVYLYQFTSNDFSGGTLIKTIGQSYALNQTLEAADCFGWSVSLDGTKLAVGAVYDDGYNNPSGYSSSGAVYIYGFSDTNFSGGSLVNTIGKGYNINQSLDLDDDFGYSVALSGTRLAVGAPYEDGSGNGYSAAGAVYLYNFTDSTLTSGSLTKRIGTAYEINPLLDGGDYFGSAVSIDGNRIAIGAYGDDGYSPFNASALNLGAVYLYTFADENFNNPNQAGVIGSGYLGYKVYSQNMNDLSDEFGYSVSIDGNRLVVGERLNDGYNNSSYNSGAVYLYTYADDAFSGGQLAGIIGNGYSGGKNINQTVEYNDNFGFSVSLDGTRLAVGAPYDDGLNNVAYNTGSVYLYKFNDSEFSGGTLIKTIGSGYEIDPVLGNSDLFGTAVSLDGARLAVGAAYDDGYNNVSTNSGGVYLYKFDDLNFTGGSLVKKVGRNYEVNQYLEGSDLFGWAISLDGTRLAVGALEDDGYNNVSGYSGSGAVYLFGFDDMDFTGGTLLQTIGKGYTVDQSLDSGDNFGTAVSLSGTSLAVGAQYDDGNNNICTNRGAVYLYTFDSNNFSTATTVNKMGYMENINVALDLNYDYFGTSVSIDGNRMAVGAKGDDGYQNIAGTSTTSDYRTGGVYLYTFSDTNFTAPVLNSIIGMGYTSLKSINVNLDGGMNNFAISLSMDGNRLVIGETYNDGYNNSRMNSGAVYLYSFTNQYYNGAILEGIIGDGYTGGKNINQTLETSDLFGASLSIDGNRLAVGAPGDDGYLNVSTDSGVVYLYTFTDSSFSGGSLVKTIGKGYNIDPASLESNDYFGYSVSLDASKLAIGAEYDDGYNNPSGYSNSGAVYIYIFGDTSFSGGTLVQQIGKGYGVDTELASDDQFGWSVSLDGDRLVVGAMLDDASDNSITNSGVVYLYKFIDSSFSSGSLIKRIGSGYEINVALESEDRFGSAVSLDGNMLAVGAYYDDGNVNIYGNSGAVYLYKFDDFDFSGGTLQTRIGKNYETNLAVAGSDMLGRAVSLDANRMAIGAYGDDGYQDIVSNSGAVYLYYIDNGTIYQSDLFGNRADKDVTLFGSTIASLLSTGQNITLQASNDITLNTDLTVNNISGNGGVFTLQAGRSVLMNGNITSDNGNVNIIANDKLSSGVLDSQRDLGVAEITMASGKTINAGTGTVNIELKDGAGKTYTDSGDITLSNIQAGSILVQNNGLTAGSDVIINSGSVLTASSSGNSLVLNTVNGNFINNAGASALSAFSGRWLVYSIDPSLTTKGGLSAGKIYNKTYLANSPASIAAGNYFLYSISPTLTITADNKTRLYGESDPAFTGSVTGYIDGDTIDSAFGGTLVYTPSSTVLSGIGSYNIVPSAVSSLGYNLSYVNGTITINKAHLTVSADDKSKTYFDDNPTLTATLTGFKNGETSSVVSGAASLNTTATKTSNAGNYGITVSQGTLSATNYDFIGFNPGTLTVNKAHLTVSADDKSKTYFDDNPTLTAILTGFKNGEDTSLVSGAASLSTSATKTSNAGNYNITSGLGTLLATNYDFIGFNPGTLTVNKAHLTVSADDKSRLYGDANPTFTASYTGFKNAEDVSVISGSPALSTSANLLSNVGTYNITSGSGTLSATNYDFIGFNPGTLTVNKAHLTVSADNKTKTYFDDNPSLTATLTGFKNGEDTSLVSGAASLSTSATKTSNAGNYGITVGQGTLSATNYDFIGFNTGTLTINKAHLTVSADDKSRLYGDANPAFTASYTGFKNGEDVSVISGAPALTTSANLLSNVGTYNITSGLGTLSATNYDFIGFNPGTLTVNKAHLTVSADNKTKTYFDDNPSLTATLTGFKNGEDTSLVSGAASLSTSATKTSNAGNYGITVDQGTLSAGNYDFIGFNPGTLTVNKALLNITADSKTRIYGAENPPLTASYSGFVNNETTADLGGIFSLTTSATKDSVSGDYAIIPSGYISDNYNIAYHNGNLSVRPPVRPPNQEEALVISTINLDHATDEHIETINKNVDSQTGNTVQSPAVNSSGTAGARSLSGQSAEQQNKKDGVQERKIQIIREDTENISIFNERSLANTLMRLIKSNGNIEL